MKFSLHEVIFIQSAVFDFEYKMNFSFPPFVTDHHFILRCIPPDNDRQKLCSLTVLTDPLTLLNPSFDSFGNKYFYASIPKPHGSLALSVSGRAVTSDSPDEEFDPSCRLAHLYTLHTPLTREGENTLKLLAESPISPSMSSLDKAIALMHHVHNSITYTKNVTTVSTTADEAARLGMGVCQDLAHILISLLRTLSLPARYSAGMVKGEGESHGWAEVYLGGYWYGLDPTADLLVQRDYIKLSHGRDFSDCLITKGIFKNAAEQHHSVSVSVKEQ